MTSFASQKLAFNWSKRDPVSNNSKKLKTPKKNRRVSVASPHAISSSGQKGTMLRVYLMDDSIRAIRVNNTTSAKHVILELKKQLHLDNDAFFSLYNAENNIHAHAVKIDDEEIINEIVNAKEFIEEERHILFRSRLYIPQSILTEEESKAKSPNEGAHMLAYLEAIEYSLNMMPEIESNYTMYYLAALRLQDEFGDYHREDHKRLTLLLQKQLDKYYVSMYNNKKKSENIEIILNLYKDTVHGKSRMQTQQEFIQECKKSILYGSIIFNVHCMLKSISTDGSAPMDSVQRIGVGYNGIHMIEGKKTEAQLLEIFSKESSMDDDNNNSHATKFVTHSSAHIAKWTISPSGNVFAFSDDTEDYIYYIKCKASLASKELFYIVDDYMSVLHHPDSDIVTNTSMDELKEQHTIMPAPHVRRRSIARLRNETAMHETSASSASKSALKEGWESFWSEEQQRYYYHNTVTNVTTWDAAAATVVVNAWVVVKYSPEQRLFFEMWQDALAHIEIDKDRIDSYASRLARADIGHDELSNSVSQDLLLGIGINDSHDISKILHLKTLSSKLDKELLFAKDASKQSQRVQESSKSNEVSPWKEITDENTGKIYYWNPNTGETSWEKPIVSNNAKKSHSHRRHRHTVITDQSVDEDLSYEKKVYYKDAKAMKLIKEALKNNFVFKHLTDFDVGELAASFFERRVPINTDLIKQGDKGDYFYVVEQGLFDVYVNGQKVVEISNGGSFGELALLYNCPRAATVRSRQECQVWAIDRRGFKHIIKDASEKAYQKAKESLHHVHILRSLNDNQLDAIASAVKMTTFQSGDYIIRHGDQGEIFYMVQEGEVMCVIPPDPSKGRRKSKPIKLVKGQYFGERALQKNTPRAADVVCLSDTCTCMTLDRQAFQTLLGPLHKLISNNVAVNYLKTIPSIKDRTTEELYNMAEFVEEKTYSAGAVIQDENAPVEKLFIVREGDCVVYKQDQHVENLCAGQFFNEIPNKSSKVCITAFNEVAVISLPLDKMLSNEVKERKWSTMAKGGMSDGENGPNGIRSRARTLNRDDVQLSDLTEIKVLGEGSFGRVTLVKDVLHNSIWALKKMSKRKLDDLKQKVNVMNEKNVLSMLNHPFILHLEATFQDEHTLYMLIELVRGGELFNYLDKQETGTVDIQSAWFYSACMISAFSHIHSHNIVYRDIKPENILIDEYGYLRVVDFGFSKIIKNRTHTLCGTPEYFAPELIGGKGYGKAVDNWGIGILIYEMLVGQTPFVDMEHGNNQIVCKNICENGLMLPRKLQDKNCRDLIQKLLEKDPIKRIGCGVKGTKEIKSHKWFETLDWDKLDSKEYTAPWIPTLNGEFDVEETEEYWEEVFETSEYTWEESDWCKDF